MAREERVRIELDDRIWGINGTYRKKEKADGIDSDEELWYIYYHPAKDAHRSLKDYLLTLVNRPPLYKTPEPIPKSQFRRKVCPHAGDVPGVPAQKMVLMATKDGDAYWDDTIASSLSRDLQQTQREKNRKQAESQRERVSRLKERRRSANESESSGGQTGTAEIG